MARAARTGRRVAQENRPGVGGQSGSLPRCLPFGTTRGTGTACVGRRPGMVRVAEGRARDATRWRCASLADLRAWPVARQLLHDGSRDPVTRSRDHRRYVRRASGGRAGQAGMGDAAEAGRLALDDVGRDEPVVSNRAAVPATGVRRLVARRRSAAQRARSVRAKASRAKARTNQRRDSARRARTTRRSRAPTASRPSTRQSPHCACVRRPRSRSRAA